MKKLLVTAAALLLLVALAIALGSLRWRPGNRAGPPRLVKVTAGAGPLSAGVAEREIELPPDVTIAGFPRLRWVAGGVRDPVHVRALVLSAPGSSVALVSVEIILVPRAIARAVEERIHDLKLDHVVVAATHTHAGPGSFWDEKIAEMAALGPYRAAFAEHLVARIADAVRAAAASRAPATLSTGRAAAAQLARNRAGGDVDGRLVAARVARASGEPLAEVVVFPAHPTLLGSKNERISGDWPGALARGRDVPLLFFQGAVGDQSARPPHGKDPVERYARRVAWTLDRVEQSPPDPAPALAVATVAAVLPPPDLGASPTILKRLTKNLLYGWFPDRALVAAVRLGPITFLVVPGEPVAEVGRRWRERSGVDTEVLALANEYLGYVETEERMSDYEGETVRTYYGPELADRLGAALELAAAEVGKITATQDQNRTAGAPASVQER